MLSRVCVFKVMFGFYHVSSCHALVYIWMILFHSYVPGFAKLISGNVDLSLLPMELCCSYRKLPAHYTTRVVHVGVIYALWVGRVNSWCSLLND